MKKWIKLKSDLNDIIDELNMLIWLMDNIEDSRSLTSSEKEIHLACKAKLTECLNMQKNYWKQRGKIKWVTLGDENSKFFHSLATIQQRRNKIACIRRPDDSLEYKHEGKPALLWDAYKTRLGMSEFHAMSLPPD